jgi:hypothetical protein
MLRFNLDEFKQILAAGKGDMPAFPALSSANQEALYAYLLNPEGKARPSRVAETSQPLSEPILSSAAGEGYMSPPGDLRAYNIQTSWQC